jgi:transcriptional regulator with XRE-family HTH domain
MNQVKIRRYTDIEVEGLGARIQEARKATKQSLESLASSAGISRVYWYDIEAERVRDALPEETLRKIERALGVEFGVKL